MRETFSFRESCELLQINPKSFQEWLKKAGIDPNAQVDKFDPRRKYLTREQLLMLAEAHGRVLPPLDIDVKQPGETVGNEALANQLAAMRQQQDQRFEQVDRVLAQLATQMQEITAQQHDLQGRSDLLRETLTQAVSFIQELLPRTSNGHNNGSQKAGQPEETTLVAAVAPFPVPTKASTRKQQGKTARSKPSARKKKPVRGKRLPAGLVLLRDFAGKHSIVTERASAAGKAGKITVVQGKWLVNSRWATEALDAQGQREFYETFHQREGFTPCEQCPHSLPHVS